MLVLVEATTVLEVCCSCNVGVAVNRGGRLPMSSIIGSIAPCKGDPPSLLSIYWLYYTILDYTILYYTILYYMGWGSTGVFGLGRVSTRGNFYESYLQVAVKGALGLQAPEPQPRIEE